MEYNCEWLKHHINDIDPPTFPCEWAKRNWHKTASQITEPFPCDNLREKWEGGGDNYRTVLYTDGTFIINEKERDIAKNVALHGDATNVYPALDATHLYEFNIDTERYWHTQRTSIKSVEFGSPTMPTSTKVWFASCTNLTSFNWANFDTSNVIDMSNMFDTCNSLTSLDLSEFNTSKVKSMYYMFAYSGLIQLDLSSFDTSNVTIMSGMFSNCVSLQTIDLLNLNTNNVTDMSFMFYNCKSLTSLDLSDFNTDNVRTMKYMFANCVSLTSLDLSSFDTSSVTNIGQMFASCTTLVTITTSPLFVVNQVSNSGYMFEADTSLIGGAGTPYDSAHIDKEYARIDNPPTEPGYFTAK